MQALAYANYGFESIYALHFNTGTGAFGVIGRVAEAPNAGFLAVHPNRRFLFAVNQSSDFTGEGSGAVSAFAINQKTGGLKLLNTVPSCGAEPCFISVDRSGRNVLVANYAGGNIAVLPITADGHLGTASALVQHTGSSIHPQRQSRPFPHSIRSSPDSRFVITADLGLDKLLVYRFDPQEGVLLPCRPEAFEMRPGSGPRHFTFHWNGRWAYVVNELRSEVTALGWNRAHGHFSEIHTISTVPGDFFRRELAG